MAVSETVSQFPPLRVNFPLPIRVRISSGVSLGPLANGVYLEKSPPSEGIASGPHPRVRGGGLCLPLQAGCSQRQHLSPQGEVSKARATSLPPDLPEAGLSFSRQASTTPACPMGLGSGHSPRQHGVQQNAQAPDVTTFIVTLALQHLAGRRAGECGQSERQ